MQQIYLGNLQSCYIKQFSDSETEKDDESENSTEDSEQDNEFTESNSEDSKENKADKRTQRKKGMDDYGYFRNNQIKR